MKTLFVCEGNMMRSQVAEAFYNSLTGTHDAMSAGTSAYGADRASQRAIAVMNEVGLSLEGQYSKQLTKLTVEQADKIVLFHMLGEPSYLSTSNKVERWSVTDLGFGEAETLEFDRQVRDDIRQRLEQLVEELND